MPTPPLEPTLPWTGERMIPHQSDPATELFHWQRYLYFRPWYIDAKVIDAASGEGYGIDYAATFAKSTHGVDLSTEAIEYATHRYPTTQFSVADVCQADYSDADLVTSFETIEHLPNPIQFLKAVGTCKGKIVISTPNRNTHSPGNSLEDKPLNPFHTVEWTPTEFAELIRDQFPDRQVRFLSQEANWPGLIREGLDENAMYCIAVIGDGELPRWPSIGLAMPTVNNSAQAQEAILALTRYYPGELTVAVTTNGSDSKNLSSWREFAGQFPNIIRLIQSATNIGYGRGANLGLHNLSKKGSFDLLGVTNDDVYPSVACLSEIAYAWQELTQHDVKVGMIGAVSNNVSGQQKVDIGDYTDLPSMMRNSRSALTESHSSVTPWPQIRGLFFVMPNSCLEIVGGFDPIFGLGNLEDDDLNLRVRLAGFTNWICDGAFVHHQGSTTFHALNIDYKANIDRNTEIFCRKWQLTDAKKWIELDALPQGVSIKVPLQTPSVCEIPMEINGETVDVLTQATDVEFAAWVFQQLPSQDLSVRRRIADAIRSSSESTLAA